MVSHDQTLTIEILKVANSAFHIPSTPIKTPHHALVYLRLSSTQNIILTSVMRRLYKGKDEPYNKYSWKHFVALTTACKAMAKALKERVYVAEEAFVAMINIYCSTWRYSLNRLGFEQESLKEGQLKGLSEEIKAEMEKRQKFFTF